MRRVLTEAEIAERFRRVYFILYEAGRRAQAQHEAQRQNLHVVPQSDSSTLDEGAPYDEQER